MAGQKRAWLYEGVPLLNEEGNPVWDEHCCKVATTTCAACESSLMPQVIRVRFSGIVEAAAAPCGNCDQFNWPNVEYELDNAGLLDCDWQLIIPNLCSITIIKASVRYNGTDYILEIFLGSGAIQTDYEVVFGPDRPNCRSWNNLAVPLKTAPGSWSCDSSGSVAHVFAGP
jgi:hypothetical protein